MTEAAPQSAPSNAKYLLLGADRRPYRSATPASGDRRRRVPALRGLPARRLPKVEERMITNHFSARRHLDEPTPASPRIPEHWLASHPDSTLTPAPHTPDEVRALVAMLRAADASTITIGHGRHTTSRATATAVADTWTQAGETVLGTVDWPEQAASWLKPARQLVRTHPDAWVIMDNPAGCAQLAKRLIELEGWSPFRTFGTASLDSVDALLLTGIGVLTGMRGVSQDGATWHLGYGALSRYPAIATP